MTPQELDERVLEALRQSEEVFLTVKVPLPPAPFLESRKFSFLLLSAFIAEAWLFSQGGMTPAVWVFLITGGLIFTIRLLGALLRETMWEVRAMNSCSNLAPHFVLYCAKLNGVRALSESLGDLAQKRGVAEEVVLKAFLEKLQPEATS